MAAAPAVTSRAWPPPLPSVAAAREAAKNDQPVRPASKPGFGSRFGPAAGAAAIVQVAVAGVASAVFAALIARTVTVCWPTASPV